MFLGVPSVSPHLDRTALTYLVDCHTILVFKNVCAQLTYRIVRAANVSRSPVEFELGQRRKTSRLPNYIGAADLTDQDFLALTDLMGRSGAGKGTLGTCAGYN